MNRVNAQTCHELHVSVMRSIALGLGIEESYFDDKIQEQYHNLRLLSYPSITSDIIRKDGQSRAGAHSGQFNSTCFRFFPTDSFTDYGTLTLLFQDHVWASYPFLHFSKADTKKNDTQVGGLEVQNPHTLQFQPARPIVRTQGYLR